MPWIGRNRWGVPLPPCRYRPIGCTSSSPRIPPLCLLLLLLMERHQFQRPPIIILFPSDTRDDGTFLPRRDTNCRKLCSTTKCVALLCVGRYKPTPDGWVPPVDGRYLPWNNYYNHHHSHTTSIQHTKRHHHQFQHHHNYNPYLHRIVNCVSGMQPRTRMLGRWRRMQLLLLIIKVTANSDDDEHDQRSICSDAPRCMRILLKKRCIVPLMSSIIKIKRLITNKFGTTLCKLVGLICWWRRILLRIFLVICSSMISHNRNDKYSNINDNGNTTKQ